MGKEQLKKLIDELTVEEVYQARLIVARNKFWTPEIEKLLRRWRKQINTRYTEHTKLEAKYTKRYYLLGIPNSVFSAVVATGILVTFQNCTACTPAEADACANDQWIRLALGIIQVLAAVLATIFVFMDYGGASGDNKNASVDYGDLARLIDSVLEAPVSSRGDPIHFLQTIRTKFDDITKRSPTVPSATGLEYINVNEKNLVAPKIKDVENLNLTSLSPRPSVRSPRHKMPDASSLAKILINKIEEEEERGIVERKLLVKANDYNTDEENDREVAIRFDLESMRPEDIIEATKKPNVQDSLTRALEFELGRLYAEDYVHDVMPPEKPRRKRRKGKKKSDDIVIEMEEIPKEKEEEN